MLGRQKLLWAIIITLHMSSSSVLTEGSSWPWSYGSRIYNYLCTYHHWCCEFKSRSGCGVQHYVIKFVSDLRQVGGFLRVLRYHHDITEILLKGALNTIKQTNKQTKSTGCILYLCIKILFVTIQLNVKKNFAELFLCSFWADPIFKMAVIELIM